MNSLQTVFHVEIELLAPLHIGTGRELLGYDIVTYAILGKGGYTCRVNEDTLLERALLRAESAGAAEMNRLLSGRPASELLTIDDFRDLRSPLFRYVLPGMPNAKTLGSSVREQLKDAFDRLYLPGSSLKGALRTQLLRAIYETQDMRPDLKQLGRNRTWAAQGLERSAFGRDPNHDFLRALHVEDSQPVPWDGRMAVRTAQIYPAGQGADAGIPIDIEVIRRGAKLHTTIRVDEYGFQGEPARQLGWQALRQQLASLPEWAKQQGEAHLQTELAYHQRSGPPAVADWYRQMQDQARALPAGSFVLHLGWGTGWESKTLGSDLIRQDERVFEEMLRQYRMTKEDKRHAGDAFPKGRHLLAVNNQPTEPLGWVRVKMEEQ